MPLIPKTEYNRLAQTYAMQSRANLNGSGYGYVSPNAQANDASIYPSVAVSSQTGNKCTDGDDNGKIGLFSIIGCALKGAVKGVVNGVKGMFTNKEGKFSLGKTLFSVGLVAACIAFPAVGVAACAIGAVAGAVTLGKGIYRANQAKTDAEAKDAWENIGDGIATVAISVAGAKGSIKAVKATSSAGGYTEGGKAVSALDSLKANAGGGKVTMRQYASALGKDMLSSTKNQGAKISNLWQTRGLDGAELFNKKLDAQQNLKYFEDAYGPKESWTPEIEAKWNQCNLEYQKADFTLSTREHMYNAKEAVSTKYSEVKQSVTNKAEIARDSAAQRYTSIKETGRTVVDSFKPGETGKMARTELVNSVRETAGNLKQSAVNKYQTLRQNAPTTLENAKATITNKAQGLKTNGTNYVNNAYQSVREGVTNIRQMKPADVRAGMANLSSNGKAIMAKILDPNCKYDAIVQEYGWSNVATVVKAFYGTNQGLEYVTQ